MRNLRILAIVLAIFSISSPAWCTLYDFNIAVPGGADFMNNVAPDYMNLTFSNSIGIIDQATATSLAWSGIEGTAGLFLAAGFTDFQITFPAVVGEVSFLVASPFGNQIIMVDGSPLNISFTPFTETLTLNSQILNITARDIFAFDSLATAPSSVPVPSAIWLLSSGLISLAVFRKLHG